MLLHETELLNIRIEYLVDNKIDHHIINLYDFMMDHTTQYQEICTYLNITPSDLFADIKEVYLQSQWKRKPNDKK